MAQANIDEERMKELFKDALVELFDERKDLLRELVADALEDVALVHAIKEGAAGATVSRKEVFDILEGEA
jgi:ribosomal protein L12E/L44/L45/RPP1/RPP2